MADFKDKTMDYLKLAALAFVPALVIALVLGFVSSAFGAMGWVMYFILGAITIYAVAKVPKEAASLWGIIILVFFLLGIQGVIGMVIPSFSMLQWANVASVSGFLVTLVSAALGAALIKKWA